MATWTIEDDTLLSDTILDYLGKGASIMDAMVKTAKKLNVTIESVSGRWYDHLQPKFKEAMEKIQSSVKRINEYVGPWSDRENQKFMDLMVQLQVEDKGVKESILEVSKSFGRSVSGCSSQWYNYILPRNRLTISNMITEGKEKMAITKTTGLVRNWSGDQENIAVSIVLSTVKSGGTIKFAFDKIAEKLSKSRSTVRSYWYDFLYEENSKTVSEARGKELSMPSQGSSVYDDEMKLRLYTLIADAGSGITQAIKDAAEAIGRPNKEVHNIWYNHLRNNEVIKQRYEDTKGAVTVVKKSTTTSGEFSELEDQAILGAVITGIKGNKSIVAGFQEVASFLNRSFSEIETRWRKTLQYKYVNEMRAARDNKPEEVKQETQVTPTPEPQVVEEVQQVTGFDISKMNEFIEMVNNVIEENKTLKAQLAEVGDKLSKYEELEAQNKQLVEAMDRAKQFLNLDIQAVSQAN